MQEELTVRVEHPELPAIRWNEAEVQQNLTEMLAAYTGRVYTPDTIKDAKADRAAGTRRTGSRTGRPAWRADVPR